MLHEVKNHKCAVGILKTIKTNNFLKPRIKFLLFAILMKTNI